MLMDLPAPGDAGFKFTSSSSNSQNSTVSLGGACNHVFDEVSVSRGINDGNTALAGLRIPQGERAMVIPCMVSFQFVQDPGVLEGALPSWKPSFQTFPLFSV